MTSPFDDGDVPTLGRLGAFVVITLVASWAIFIATIADTVPAYTAPLVMLVPAIVTLAIRRAAGTPIRTTVGRSLRGTTPSSLVFAVVYPVAFIGLAAAIALLAGLGTYTPGVQSAVDQVVARGGLVALVLFFGLNFVITYGEELGWRGYLLPALTAHWGRVRAPLVVGVVWGVYHSAFLYLAARALGVPNPLFVSVVQAGAVVTISVPFAYSYYVSRGSVVGPIVLHLLWNVLNPWLLGDIYGNVPGLVAGRVVLVSGEGVLVLVLGTVAAIGFVAVFRRGVGLDVSPRR
ncbi:MAG: lysostaphin resistance A-like protein [Halanaeroarchaeum sp.]